MKTLFKVALGLVSLGASAAFAGSGWVDVTTSDVGSWQENGGEFFVSIDRVINTENCAQNVAQLRWADSALQAGAMYSTLLAAAAAARPVRVYVYGCTSSGWPQLWGVKLIP